MCATCRLHLVIGLAALVAFLASGRCMDRRMAVVEKLCPCRDEMFQRLLRGEAMARVAEDIAGRVGASPEQVKAFYNGTWEAVGNAPSDGEADEAYR